MAAGATSSKEEEKEKNDRTLQLPVGYRFQPTDLELVKHYLLPKVLGHPLPADIIQHIHESKLYSKPPNKLEIKFFGGKECFFFTHRDGCSHDGLASIRKVGDGKGYWKSAEEGTFISDLDGHKIAFKNYWNYYSGTPEKGKMTRWVMSEYRLNMENDQDNNQEDVEQWTLARIKYGWDYKSPLD